MSLIEREPVLTATIPSAIAAVLNALVALDVWELTGEQLGTINTAVVAILAIPAALIARSVVTPTAKLEQ